MDHTPIHRLLPGSATPQEKVQACQEIVEFLGCALANAHDFVVFSERGGKGFYRILQGVLTTLYMLEKDIAADKQTPAQKGD